MTPVELWSAQQVAEHLELASAASARRTLSRWGVRAADYAPAPSGRVEARYAAAEVRKAHAARPGRGSRSDLT